MLVFRRVFQEWLLIFAALFAIIWAAVRASVQSITMDEADTYFWFVAPSNVWRFFPNNHVLNSLLMWLSTRAFGISSLALRAPAILGAILYIVTCLFLCRRVTDRLSIQIPVLICLIYNPLIFDYMVAARGYGLADAFLLLAIAVPVWHSVRRRLSLCQSCALASLALGLAFAASFAFAFVLLAAFLAITAWAIWRRDGESIARIVAFCALPGLFIVLLICGYPLAHWTRDDLTWGAHSLREMRQSLVQSSLYRLDPQFHDTAWYRAVSYLRPLLPPALAILCLCQLVVTTIDGSWLRDPRARWLAKFASALAGIVTLSALLHWLAFRFAHLLLPVGRTGIFFVPLITLLAGTIAAAPARSVLSQWLRRGITAVLLCLACYFLLCLRLSYFKEYQWDADAKQVYSVLATYNRTYGVTDIGIFDLYAPALNYYRLLSNSKTFPELKSAPPDPTPGKSIYVMSQVNQRSFIDQEKLVVVYRGRYSDTVIAVKPGGPLRAAPIGR
jgi:hypothetical protein